MTTAAESIADTPPELPRFYYRPRVELDYPDFRIDIGDYRLVFFSGGMRSTGAIGYKHLLAVLDRSDFDPLYVAAETNDRDGDGIVYLGRFSPHRHATLINSPLLAHAGFFIPVACMVAREALELTYEQYSLTQAEDYALGLIPGLIAQVFPQGGIDENTLDLIRQLRECVLRSS